MVLIEIKDDIATFVCTECGRVITTGQNFLIDPKVFPKNKITVSRDKFFYSCRCGAKYELIKSSNPNVQEFLKFKHVKVVEQEYILN